MASSKVQTVALLVLSLVVLLAHLAGARTTISATISSEDLLSGINQTSDCKISGPCKDKADCVTQCNPLPGICVPYDNESRCCCITS